MVREDKIKIIKDIDNIISYMTFDYTYKMLNIILPNIYYNIIRNEIYNWYNKSYNIEDCNIKIEYK